jgi:hypothetical protein
MSDLRAFGKRAKRLGANVAQGADTLVRKVAVAVDTSVVLGTPVDTGRARSNWQVNLDSPVTGTLSDSDFSAALRKGEAVIAKYSGDRNTTLHITNNLAYIGRLNNGYSAQAPAGFVSAAVLAGALAVKGARLIIKRGDQVIGGDLGRIG